MAEKYQQLMLFICFVGLVSFCGAAASGHQPLSKIAIHRTTLALHESAFVKASPLILGLKVTRKAVAVTFSHAQNARDVICALSISLSQATFLLI